MNRIVPVCLFATACLALAACSGTGLPATAPGYADEQPGWPADPAPQTLVVPIIDVLFAPGSASLPDSAQRSAATVAGLMREHPRLRVRIEGHTDDRGSPQANRALSVRRAEAFGEALVRAGVEADRIELIGRGEGAPLASNASATGRAQNRRVDIAFSDPKGQFPPALLGDATPPSRSTP